MKPAEIVEITLSRPYYRLGGSVVGTVRVVADPSSTSSKSSLGTIPARPSLRDSIESLKLTVTGFCRLDPRWHGKEEVTALLQRFHHTHHPQEPADQQPSTVLLPPHLNPLPSNTAPIWSSGTMELMELEERQVGRWSDAKPHPIVLPRGYRRDVPPRHRPASTVVQQEQEQPSSLEEQQLAFTFRVTLPKNAPHTLVATSCRYYYTVSVQLQRKNNNTSVVECTEVPITVYTALPGETDDADGSSSVDALYSPPRSRIIPPFQAVAHSSGLPTHLTTAELHQWEGQWTVTSRRNATALYGGTTATATQTLQVADPTTGRPIAVLTLVGLSPSLYPGSRLLLKLDFPVTTTHHHHPQQQAKNWIPCYQASACLLADEMAMAVSSSDSGSSLTMTAATSGIGSTTSGKGQRARRHLLATAHYEIVDPSATESISLNLIVPDAVPCSIAATRDCCVEIAVQCLVDLCIAADPGATAGRFRNLHLEIPCRITHAPADWEASSGNGTATSTTAAASGGGEPPNDEESPSKRWFEELLWTASQSSSSNSVTVQDNNELDSSLRDPRNFQYQDIMEELKILSLHMADACGLRPVPGD